MKQTKRNRFVVTGLLFLAIAAGLQAQWKHVPNDAKMPEHPRLLMLDGEEQTIKAIVASDPARAKVHRAIIDECDRIAGLPELERIMTGKRLLSVSREAIRRIFYLSYAYRMTAEARYLAKAEREMLALAAFEDWNPSHFLDVAEATMALAIGYDWLYKHLSEASRTTIAAAILAKGLDPALNDAYAWYLTAPHNWNQVCNAGITFGALAIHENLPELSRTFVDRAVETVRLPMKDYEPDGAYPEGYGYWEYGTTFNVMLLSALEKIYGTSLGLDAPPTFLKTAGYQQNMTGPSYLCYNYADCGLGGSLSPAMFWFAAKRNDPSLLWNEKHYLETRPAPVRDRILPALMIWGSDIRLDNVPPPQELLWTGGGVTPVALMRTSWTDGNALFAGIKGGTASSNHAHMDAGSFVIEADGVRWASDFGAQDYNSLETNGVDLWNRAQNSQRWEVFRYSNRVHNTLTVDNQLHRVKGFAGIRSSSSSPDFMNATVDLSEVFEGQLDGCTRGIAIVDRRYVAVRDEFRTADRETAIRWTLLTTADAKLKGDKTIELRKDGKKLTVEISAPVKITLKTWPTTPAHNYDAPNPGATLVGFEATIPAGTNVAWTVRFIPQSARRTSAEIPELAQWPNDSD
ncbi:MAG: heparinase II/III family protein [Tannerella sp.]|jgi:hypothetical protein|nr:heparinase II/III family protein [Tannerella sp.]